MIARALIDRTQVAARRYLSPAIRRPVGAFCGKVLEGVFYPFLGFIFDVSGGRFRANGCVFAVPRSITRASFRACFLFDDYEVDERRLIPKYLRPSDSVLEFGACLGVVSCISNRILALPRKHVVVEANPKCLPAIHRNRELNGCDFLVESCAISTQKEVTFYLHPRFIVGGSVQNQSGIPVRVPGRSLAELHQRHGPFSVLIMDIEGGELEVLRSSGAALNDFRLVVVELHEWNIGKNGVEECRSLLRSYGFELIDQSYITEVWRKPEPAA